MDIDKIIKDSIQNKLAQNEATEEAYNRKWQKIKNTIVKSKSKSTYDFSKFLYQSKPLTQALACFLLILTLASVKVYIDVDTKTEAETRNEAKAQGQAYTKSNTGANVVIENFTGKFDALTIGPHKYTITNGLEMSGPVDVRWINWEGETYFSSTVASKGICDPSKVGLKVGKYFDVDYEKEFDVFEIKGEKPVSLIAIHEPGSKDKNKYLLFTNSSFYGYPKYMIEGHSNYMGHNRNKEVNKDIPPPFPSQDLIKYRAQNQPQDNKKNPMLWMVILAIIIYIVMVSLILNLKKSFYRSKK